MDETLHAKGVLVGRQEWDSGGPGAGAGALDVCKFRGEFYSSDDVGNYGPYAMFMEAARAVGLFEVNNATTSIWVNPMKAKVTAKERIAILKAADEANRSLALQQRKCAAEEP
jgi:hypothetical protein